MKYEKVHCQYIANVTVCVWKIECAEDRDVRDRIFIVPNRTNKSSRERSFLFCFDAVIFAQRPGANMSKRTNHVYRKIFASYFIPVATTFFVGLFLLAFWKYGMREQRILDGERFELMRKTADIHEELLDVSSDLLFLSQQREMKQFLCGCSLGSELAIAQEYASFAKNKHKYAQIRFLNMRGKEVVRVDYDHEQAIIVPEDQLQDKSSRYYFRDARYAAPGEVIVSALDLNMENGIIEFPHRPMLRFSTPLADSLGAIRGVVVLNYNAQWILDNIAEKQLDNASVPLLVNQEGYFLKGFSAHEEWGFQQKQSKNQTMAARYPRVWQKMKMSASGSEKVEGGTLIWLPVYHLSHSSILGKDGSVSRLYNRKLDSSKIHWRAASFIPSEPILSKLNIALGSMFIVLALVSGVLSHFIARARLRQRYYRIRDQKAQKLLHTEHEKLKLAMGEREVLMNKTLRQKEKLEALDRTKNQFFSIIAHDLRSPLAGFLSVSDLLASDAGFFPPDELKSIAQSMSKTGGQLNQLLENLLEWSRSQTGNIQWNPEEYEPIQLLSSIQEMYSETAKNKGIDIEIEPDNRMKVYCDWHMIHTVLRNLVSNALKFTPAGGRIILRTVMTGTEMRFEVRDTGVGMTRAQREGIFKINVRQSTPGLKGEKGTGLGLILCQEFVGRHSSYIVVGENHEDKQGSVVVFTLPTRSIITADGQFNSILASEGELLGH